MTVRLALFDLARNWRLDPAATRRLQHLAGFDREPNHLGRTLPRGLAVLGAALAGFGILLWIAANWPTLGRVARFGLLQAAVLAAGLGAWRLPRARPALGLATLLSIGALLAFFGQTYQTGADAWQLFALWAALAVPLCLGVRGDTVWTPWAVVAMTGVSLWTWSHGVSRWGASSDAATAVHATGWALGIAVVLAMAPGARRRR